MYEKAKQFTLERPRLKRTVGIILIVAGLFALVMPLVPGIVLLVIGLEVLGLRLLFIDRLIERVLRKKKIPTEE